MTLLLGAALSAGGVSQAFDDVRFVVGKDLDGVQVVRENGEESKVVARIRDGYAGNGVFKLSKFLPERFVSREANLFHTDLFETEKAGKVAGTVETINDSIRAEFFKSSIPFGALIHRHATTYDVDPALVAAVMEAESRFKRTARSPVGAMGLMQLMPRTGRWMGARNLYDADQNVEAGVKYLKYLERRFDGDLPRIIAAYNAGEGNVKRYGGIPPFRETRTYVKKVLKNYEKRTDELQRYGRSSGDNVVASR